MAMLMLNLSLNTRMQMVQITEKDHSLRFRMTFIVDYRLHESYIENSENYCLKGSD